MLSLKSIINLYPLFISRIYAFIRSKILPIKIIDKFIPTKGRILDVGCGYGLTTIYFAQSHKNRIMVGSEINSKRINIARKISKNIKNISFKINNLLPKNQKFDTIIAIDLLHHISTSEKEIFLNECKQSLNTNGLLIIKDVDTKPFLKFLWTYIHDLLLTKFKPLDFYSSQKMSSLLQRHGFRIIKQQCLKNILYPHIIYICKKEK